MKARRLTTNRQIDPTGLDINRQHTATKTGPASQRSRSENIKIQIQHHQVHVTRLENSTPSDPGVRPTHPENATQHPETHHPPLLTPKQAQKLSNIRQTGIQQSDRSHSQLHACVMQSVSKRDLLRPWPEDQALIPNRSRPAHTVEESRQAEQKGQAEPEHWNYNGPVTCMII
jgi:hypothetical protein